MSDKLVLDQVGELPFAGLLVVQCDQTGREGLTITADKGFGDICSFPPGSHKGVLLLRPDQAGVRPVLQLLEQTLAAYDLEALVGAT